MSLVPETSEAVPFRSRSRAGIDAEPPSARRTGAAFEPHVLDGRGALRDAQRDVELVERRAAAAEVPADRERTLLQPLEQLLDIEARDRALARGQVRGAGERAGEREHAVAGRLDRERQIALAFEPAQAEQLAEAGFEIDVGELQLRFDVGARFVLWRAPARP